MYSEHAESPTNARRGQKSTEYDGLHRSGSSDRSRKRSRSAESDRHRSPSEEGALPSEGEVERCSKRDESPNARKSPTQHRLPERFNRQRLEHREEKIKDEERRLDRRWHDLRKERSEFRRQIRKDKDNLEAEREALRKLYVRVRDCCSDMKLLIQDSILKTNM